LDMKKSIVILAITTLIFASALSFLFFHYSFLPKAASSQMSTIDGVLRLLFGIGSIIFSLIIAVFTYSLLFFRRHPGDTGDGPAWFSKPSFENSWTFIPLALVIGLGIYGGIVLIDMTELPPPQSQVTINVTAFRFGWEFYYPEQDVQSFELHMPVNGEVVLSMQSRDVIHSFWVPEFGPKQDIVPGITTEVLITPNKIGQYTVM
jgi:cytochrome c oxidase subunit 2